MPCVLIAFDKFKNSLGAREACAAAAEALTRQHPDWDLDICPLADGGEGFGTILTESIGGEWREKIVTGPRGEPVCAGFGLVRAGTIPASVRDLLHVTWTPDDILGVVEMSLASGLAQLPMSRRDPWLTESTGTGELIAAASAAGAKAIVIGVGGSATNDLGLCALGALGLEPLNRAGDGVILPTPSRWNEIFSFRGSLSATLPDLLFACDVKNPLLGPSGCSSVYGPQKGLRSEDLGEMDKGAERIAGLLCDHFGKPRSLADTPGAGAAGGMAFGFLCAAAARIIPGTQFVSAWLDIAARLDKADIVITGEGRFDASSLQGKGPGELALRAAALGKRVCIFSGSADMDTPLPKGVILCPITPPGIPLTSAFARAGQFLVDAVSRM